VLKLPTIIEKADDIEQNTHFLWQ